MVDRDDELEDAIDELVGAIRELRTELEPGRRDRGLRPPTPDELLRLTDEVAIPTLAAILEANLRALEAFQRGVRIVRTERKARDGTEGAVEPTRSGETELRRTTLEQLDAALAELGRAIDEGALPRDRRARELVEEARELRGEVDRRLRSAADDADDAAGRTIEIDDGSDENETGVDVDAELETLKDRYAAEEQSSGVDGTDEDGSEGDES